MRCTIKIEFEAFTPDFSTKEDAEQAKAEMLDRLEKALSGNPGDAISAEIVGEDPEWMVHQVDWEARFDADELAALPDDVSDLPEEASPFLMTETDRQSRDYVRATFPA